jgi:nucleotide-binding universal stress UspA family protein
MEVKPLAVMEHASPFTNILACIDGSDCSIRAARVAIELADALGAQITIACIVDTMTIDELVKTSQRPIRLIQAELEMSAQNHIRHLTQIATKHALRTTQEIRTGVPCAEISKLAKENEVDLIVIGEAGGQRLRRFTMGSATTRVIETAPCPILIIKLE